MGFFFTKAFSVAIGLGGVAKSAFSVVKNYAGSGAFESLSSIPMPKDLMRVTGELFAKAIIV